MIVPSTEVGSSSPNGRVPITTRPANAAVQTTASNETRPSSLQYTSCRWTQSANSSSVKPAPTPNPIAITCHQGDCSGAAKARKPQTSIRQMPHTRWCRCTPPSVCTPPGHHDTLRVSRALVRIAR